ncbi:MAG TPA: hypothetical protein VIY51_03705 [Xanthobacteraceae bacterium]
MTDASLPAGRFTQGDFRIGQVFSRTWSVFSRNFLTFVLVTGIASVPGLLMPQPTPGVAVDPFQNLGITAVVLLLLVVLGTLGQAVVLYAAFQVMRGRPIDLAESARIGLRRFFPIVGIAIIVPVLVGLASMLLLFPGLMLYTMWFVATPVCVVEQLGPLASMGRSRELTKGHRWKIFGMLLLLLLPAIVVGGIVGAILVSSAGAVGLLSLSAAMTSTLAQILNLIWSAIWTAFFAILIVVTYHDLRVAKEGIDTDQIAAVFE